MYNAILLGSISVLADMSELQREAFNLAFKQAGLNWDWDRNTYAHLLKKPGGLARIENYARERGEEVDAQNIYDDKTTAFVEMVQPGTLVLRPGIAELIGTAKSEGMKLGFVTSTSQTQVQLTFRGLGPVLSRADFDYIGDIDRVQNGKPAPDIYLDALEQLDIHPSFALAIEDTPECAEAALAAKVDCVGFPNEAARDRDFPDGVRVVGNASEALLREKAA